jgi:hypothetical protein
MSSYKMTGVIEVSHFPPRKFANALVAKNEREATTENKPTATFVLLFDISRPPYII